MKVISSTKSKETKANTYSTIASKGAVDLIKVKVVVEAVKVKSKTRDKIKYIINKILEKNLVEYSSNISASIDRKLEDLVEQIEILIDKKLSNSLKTLNYDLY